MAQTATSKATPGQIKPAAVRRFHIDLAAWYATHGRHDLPWRHTDDPYKIWLSEVMLQQTQVSTVLARFYDPFLKKFPTIQSLADAPRESVMKAWEGLGYYRRAGNLHEAAQKARNGMPKDVAGLLTLPGIGRNTASAIAAFAYHQPVAILEANVKRIISRIFALETPSENKLWSGAEQLLNREHPFDYNQAMMDIGATICTPKNPDCPACPANIICRGKVNPECYPTPKVKKQVPTREVIIHVREDASGRLFLEARDATLLGGLYGFPQTPYNNAKHRIASHDEPRSVGSSRVTPSSGAKRQLGTVTHAYSHFKLIGHVVYERLDTRPNSPTGTPANKSPRFPSPRSTTKPSHWLKIATGCKRKRRNRISGAKHVDA
ncbi:MAG: A/G-specific adenine glycosylase [Rickettsiales bacterium]